MIAEAVKHMLDAGMLPEAIVNAIRDMEASQDKRSSSAKRQQRYRDRNKTVTNVTSDVLCNYFSDKEIPPTPPKEIITPVKEKPPKGGKKKKNPLPENFFFSENILILAKSVGLSREETQIEEKKLIDWAKGNAVLKADWEATARNWIRNARPNRQTFNQGKTNDRYAVRDSIERGKATLRSFSGEDFSTGNGVVIDVKTG